MPIIIVHFIDPVVLPKPSPPMLLPDGWINPAYVSHHFFREMVDEITAVSDRLPRVVLFPDGKSKRGYLSVSDGVDFDLDNVMSFEVIP